MACEELNLKNNNSQEDDLVWTDVEYSDDGESVTVHLFGSGRYVSSSRALNLPLAQLGHDFFEVVFLYNLDDNPVNNVIARAIWERGQRAGISGVQRGVNYGHVSCEPPAGEGSAVLFVGNKSDKTLLAIGTISHVDNNAVTRTTALITNSTKSITFKVDALHAAVNENPENSSFITNALRPSSIIPHWEDTAITLFQISEREFPLFAIVKGSPALRAQYSLAFESGAAFDDYHNAIIVAAAGAADKREPRYSTSDGNIRKASNVFLDDVTIVTMPNHDTAAIGHPLKNPIDFSFNTLDTKEGSVFSLVFEIPVFVLSSEVDASGGNPVQWYIRPGYGTNLYDLDDGTGAAGGAILCGNGFIPVPEGGRFVVITPPQVFQYTQGDRINVSGMTLQMVDPHGVTTPILPTNENVSFWISGYKIDISTFEFEGYYGLVWMEVHYQDPVSNNPYKAEKLIPFLVNAIGIKDSPTSTPYNVNFTNYVVHIVDGPGQIASGHGNTNGTHVYVLTNNVNLGNYSNVDFNAGPYLIIFVAQENAGDSYILGRTGSGGAEGGYFTFSHNRQCGYSQVYFGKWPFATVPSNPAAVLRHPTTSATITTAPFRVNAGGNADHVTNNTVNNPGYNRVTGYMFSAVYYSGTLDPGRISNFKLMDGEVEVFHKDLLH